MLTRAGDGVRFGGAGGGGAVGGMVAGMPPVTVASSGISISGGEGNSGCVAATLGRAAGGGTNTRGGVDFWNQHEVLPNDNARMKGSSRDLYMVYRRRELEAETSSPAQLACKVDSTIM